MFLFQEKLFFLRKYRPTGKCLNRLKICFYIALGVRLDKAYTDGQIASRKYQFSNFSYLNASHCIKKKILYSIHVCLFQLNSYFFLSKRTMKIASRKCQFSNFSYLNASHCIKKKFILYSCLSFSNSTLIFLVEKDHEKTH